MSRSHDLHLLLDLDVPSHLLCCIEVMRVDFVCVCLDHLGHYLYAVKILFTQLLKEVSEPGISNLNLTSLPLMMWIWHRPGGDHPWEGKDEVDLSMFNVYASLSFASHRDKHPSTAYHCVHRQLSDLQ